MTKLLSEYENLMDSINSTLNDDIDDFLKLMNNEINDDIIYYAKIKHEYEMAEYDRKVQKSNHLVQYVSIFFAFLALLFSQSNNVQNFISIKNFASTLYLSVTVIIILSLLTIYFSLKVQQIEHRKQLSISQEMLQYSVIHNVSTKYLTAKVLDYSSISYRTVSERNARRLRLAYLFFYTLIFYTLTILLFLILSIYYPNLTIKDQITINIVILFIISIFFYHDLFMLKRK